VNLVYHHEAGATVGHKQQWKFTVERSKRYRLVLIRIDPPVCVVMWNTTSTPLLLTPQPSPRRDRRLLQRPVSVCAVKRCCGNGDVQ